MTHTRSFFYVEEQYFYQEVSSLQNFTQSMQGSMDKMSIGARKINETGAALTAISNQVQESIDQIGSQIDQFKV